MVKFARHFDKNWLHAWSKILKYEPVLIMPFGDGLLIDIYSYGRVHGKSAMRACVDAVITLLGWHNGVARHLEMSQGAAIWATPWYYPSLSIYIYKKSFFRLNIF